MSSPQGVSVAIQNLTMTQVLAENILSRNALLKELGTYQYNEELTELSNELAEIDHYTKVADLAMAHATANIEKYCVLISVTQHKEGKPVFITDLSEKMFENINT